MSEDLATKIRRQVEFYFSGLNLNRDKLMREKMSADPDGFMPIETLLTFNRLKQLTTDMKVVVDAIKESDKLAFNDDFTKVKSNIDFRKPENNVALRTVHMRGFPTSATLDDLLEGLKPYGNIRFIEMRRFISNKEFKGSVNVEFNTKEEAEEFMKKKIMFAGVEITEKELLADREKSFDEKNKRYKYTPDSLLQIRNIGKDTTAEALQEFLKPYMDQYSYIFRTEGDNQAVVRFATSQEAAKALNELKDKTLSDKPLKLMILRGKKANGMWTKIKSLMLSEEAAKKTSQKRENEAEEGSEKKAKTD
ncbi:hypothetical protein WA577_007515 [Blastocystis sp. JDR]